MMMIIKRTSLRNKERLYWCVFVVVVVLGRSRTRLAATPILLQAMTRDVVEGCEALQWPWARDVVEGCEGVHRG